MKTLLVMVAVLLLVFSAFGTAFAEEASDYIPKLKTLIHKTSAMETTDDGSIGLSYRLGSSSSAFRTFAKDGKEDCMIIFKVSGNPAQVGFTDLGCDGELDILSFKNPETKKSIVTRKFPQKWQSMYEKLLGRHIIVAYVAGKGFPADHKSYKVPSVKVSKLIKRLLETKAVEMDEGAHRFSYSVGSVFASFGFDDSLKKSSHKLCTMMYTSTKESNESIVQLVDYDCNGQVDEWKPGSKKPRAAEKKQQLLYEATLGETYLFLSAAQFIEKNN
ncbi:MAG: hypothetical protein L0I62_09320 [Gammaproteobacteria bacterium]|nr:hypothetical protein [Nitrococcus sp.]MDN5865392.1 hypothetical protein [Gammaproteobacteria bacterium]